MIRKLQSFNINSVTPPLVCSVLLMPLLSGCSNNKEIKNDLSQTVTGKTEIVSKAGANALKSNILKINLNELNSCEYDSNGRIKKEYQFEENGAIYSYCEYEYNDDGSSKRDINYNADCSIDWQRDYYYNKDGSRTEITIYSDGTSCVSEYDSKDNEMNTVIYKPNGQIDLRYVYINDFYGNRYETIYNDKGNVVAVNSCTE